MREELLQAAKSVVQTLGQTFVFSGRSRRLEVGYYWAASMLITGLLKLAVSFWSDGRAAISASMAIDLAATIPFFALSARRLRDQGRSGWWTLFLPLLVVANVYHSLRVNFHAFDPAWPALGLWPNLVLIFIVIGMLVMLFYPGDVGSNRFGPDPRLDKQEPVSAS